MKVSRRESTLVDIQYLAENLRPADLAEIKASSGVSPLESLTHGFYLSEICMSIVDEEDTVVGILGVVPTDGNKAGVIWMMATEGIERCTLSFLRQSRPYISHLQTLYPLLYNYIDARNHLHIRWVKWMGFNFINTIENYGVENRRFYEIVRI